MALTLSALKTELTTDPNAYGYAPHVASGSTGALAALLNEPRTTINVPRGLVGTWEIIAATDGAEYSALNATAKDIYQTLVSAGTVDVTDAQIQAILKALFPNPSTTRTNLIARLTRIGSHAEQLFGVGVSHSDCAQALVS